MFRGMLKLDCVVLPHFYVVFLGL